MSTTMSVFCLVETKFTDQKSGIECGDAVFKIGPKVYEKFKWILSKLRNPCNLLNKKFVDEL